MAYVVNWVFWFMHESQESHYKEIKRILRYLRGTVHFSMKYAPGPLLWHAYSDANWAVDQIDRKSTSGYCLFLGPNPIVWSLKKKATISRSSTESEYRALVSTTAEICWVKMLLAKLKILIPILPIIWCDSKSAISLSSNSVFHCRTKHIELDCHFVWGKVLQNFLKVQYIPSEDKQADVFTKPLLVHKFQFFCSKLKVYPILSLRGDVKQDL